MYFCRYDKYYQTPRVWLTGYDEVSQNKTSCYCLEDYFFHLFLIMERVARWSRQIHEINNLVTIHLKKWMIQRELTWIYGCPLLAGGGVVEIVFFLLPQVELCQLE